MVKRNQTIFKWLERNIKEEQVVLLAKARKPGPQMRQQNQQQRFIVLRELQVAMERKQREGQEAQRQAEERLQKSKQAVLQTVQVLLNNGLADPQTVPARTLTLPWPLESHATFALSGP